MLNIKTLLVIGFIASLLFNMFLLNKLLSKDHSSNGEINYAFSDLENDPKALLLQSINEADETLDIAIYHFGDKEIAQAVQDAKDRGVSIRVITDAKKAKKKGRSEILDDFLQNNIEVKTIPSRKMHLKTAIIDERLVVTGSYNYTEASANENLEQLITVSNEELAAKWTDIFEELWSQNDLKEWKP